MSCLSPIAAQEPLGSEFIVNQGVARPFGGPGLAADAQGDFVVVWKRFEGGGAETIAGQLFDASGVPIGDNFQVNSYSTAALGPPAVAADAEGNFVVVWEEGGSLREGIFGRRFDSDGNPAGGEFQVNNPAARDASNPAIAADPEGNFVVVWDKGSYADRVLARRFDASGSALGDQFQVNLPPSNGWAAWRPTAAMRDDEEFVVVWQNQCWNCRSGFEMADVFGRRFDAAGSPLGSEFRVNTITAGGYYQGQAGIAMGEGGDFVVAWGSGKRLNYGYMCLTVRGQRFDSSGDPEGGEFPVSTAAGMFPGATFDRNGEFIVAWTSGCEYPWASPDGVRGRRFDRDSSPVGGEFQVNTPTLQGGFGWPVVAPNAEGDFVVVWATGFSTGNVLGQRFARPGLHLSVEGSCPGPAEVLLTGAPPDSEVAVVAGANTNGFVKGGALCSGTAFTIGEPFALPPTFVIVDGAGNGVTTLEMQPDHCWVQALALDDCETSNTVEVP